VRGHAVFRGGARRCAFWLPVSFAISFYVTEIAHQPTE
jgi:hypothetical protein